MKKIAVSCLALTLIACGETPPPADETSPAANPAAPSSAATAGSANGSEAIIRDIDEIARDYVSVALAFGEFDPDYVDAYTGPEDWKESALSAGRTLDQLFTEAAGLSADLALTTPPQDEVRRAKILQGNLQAMIARMRMVRGETLSFNDETALIYDAVVPEIDPAIFDAALAELDEILPGDGSIAERREALQAKLEVPEDKIEEMIRVAIAECRKRTQAYYDLPEDESFTLELVRDKPWSGYNWYQGDYESLIQINLDQPFRVDRALDLGCHEGYPGHHVWNIYTERYLLKENNWIEYYVFPLFSPGAFFAEGSANYGVDVAFPGSQKKDFERDVLYPIADIDPALAEIDSVVAEASRQLQFVTVYVARNYLDGNFTRDEAIDVLQKYRLVSRERAEQSLDFIEKYRGYVINYSHGYNLVKAYIEARAETEAERWAIFEDMLRNPKTASDLVLPESDG
ncbi:hypothetical protein [Parvularcula sp. IMCC14364]|uniref:hypothetical protein n=1 Tax=Parvularcula sp. IMCC14364 TaxID=3067902 RepID=UPI002741AF92|nr:hypothetical protein [Parvularcula sp. IMCC14364]